MMLLFLLRVGFLAARLIMHQGSRAAALHCLASEVWLVLGGVINASRVPEKWFCKGMAPMTYHYGHHGHHHGTNGVVADMAPMHATDVGLKSGDGMPVGKDVRGVDPTEGHVPTYIPPISACRAPLVGRFDYWCNSHQIMHVLALVAMAHLHWSVREDYAHQAMVICDS